MKIKSKVLEAVFWGNLSCIASAIMVSIVRYVSQELNIIEILFFRNLFAFLIFLPIVIHFGLAKFKTNMLGMHFLRSITGITAMVAYFYSISKMNLSVVTAISFSAPLFMAVMSYFFLKDRFGAHRTISLIIGFIGALIVIRPGLEGYDEYSIYVLFAAVFWALSGIIIKHLSKTDSPLAITFYMTVFMTLFSLPFTIYFWETPSYENLFWIFLIAVSSNILQFSLAKSLSLVDMSVILPVDFTRLIYTAIAAYIAFGETMDIPAFIGSVIIVSAAAYTAYRQNKKSKIKPTLDKI